MSAACAAPVNTAVSTKLATKRVMNDPWRPASPGQSVLLSGIPIVVPALPFHLACRVSSETVRACARPQSARVEAATFPFMDVLKCRMTAAKPVPGARPASTPIAPFRTCHELTRKPAHRGRWILCRTRGWTFASRRRRRRKNCCIKFIGGTFGLTRIISHIQRRTRRQIEKYSTNCE